MVDQVLLGQWSRDLAELLRERFPIEGAPPPASAFPSPIAQGKLVALFAALTDALSQPVITHGDLADYRSQLRETVRRLGWLDIPVSDSISLEIDVPYQPIPAGIVQSLEWCARGLLRVEEAAADAVTQKSVALKPEAKLPEASLDRFVFKLLCDHHGFDLEDTPSRLRKLTPVRAKSLYREVAKEFGLEPTDGAIAPAVSKSFSRLFQATDLSGHKTYKQYCNRDGKLQHWFLSKVGHEIAVGTVGRLEFVPACERVAK